jgi:hypothetical protein
MPIVNLSTRLAEVNGTTAPEGLRKFQGNSYKNQLKASPRQDQPVIASHTPTGEVACAAFKH